jgi:class 3 adenylate cyclase/tetratricopeptide (TPR) repeat protein
MEGDRQAGPSLQVDSGRAPSGEERRQVTVLFADLVGSTALAGQMDPEELRPILGSFFAAIARQVQRFDGTLDKYIGDAVMAVFGAPVSHEDDAARALLAALAIHDAIDELAPEVGERYGVRLAVRIGVNSGEVVSGVLEHDVQRAYTVVGEAVNVAQRLQAAASPSEILVGPATRRLARAFAFDPPRQISVKGLRDPVIAHPLSGTPTTRPEGPATALVGREPEIAAIAAALDAVAAGQGRFISVIGEAGVGKSRLFAEVRRSRDGLAERWLEGRAVSIGRTVSYLPFLEMIRADAGIGDGDDEAAVRSKLEARIAALFPSDVPEVLPYVTSLLGLPLRGTDADRLRYLEADAMRRQIFLVSRRYLSRLAEEQPLAILIEDLHWADDSTMALLEHVLPLIGSAALAVCVTARPDASAWVSRLRETAIAASLDAAVEVPLAPLGAADSALVIEGILGGAADDGIRDLVRAKTEGNPFFIEEVTRSLIEAGALETERSRWRLARPAEELAIPDTVEGVIRARIDRLDDEVKHVVRVAAVIGRSFFYRILRAVAEADRELDDRLAELQRLQLIVERERLPELAYIFRHVLIQESTYESILVRKRRELHRRTGEAIERVFAKRLEDLYGPLAYHFARAEDWTKAQDYLFRAADQAGRVAGDAEALALYDEAVAAYARAFGDRWDPLQRGRLERKIGEALFRVGEHGKAAEHLHRALGYFGRPFPTTPARVRLGIAGELVRQIGHRVLPGRLPAPESARIDTVVEEQLRAYEVLAWIDYYLDTERLLLDSIRLLNESEKRGWPLGIVMGSLGMGIVCDFVPAFGLAEQYHRRGVALAERTERPFELGYAYLGLGYHQQRTGEWDGALDHWGRGAAYFHEAGDIAKWGAATWGTTWLAHRTGRVDRSKAQSEELIRIGQDTADRQLQGWGLYFLGRWTWQSGDIEAGIRSLEAAIDLFRLVPDLPNLAGASGELGICHLRLGRWSDAVEVLERTARLMREKDIRGFLAHVHNALADAYLARAEASVGAERDRALDLAARAARSAATRSKVEREGFVGAYRASGTHAWLVGRRARARTLWNESVASAERLGTRYDLATTLFEIGRRAHDAAALEAAERIFAELRAARDVAAVREAR